MPVSFSASRCSGSSVPVTGGQTVEQSALRDLEYDLESYRPLPEGRSEVMRKAVHFNMLRCEIDVDPEALGKSIRFRHTHFDLIEQVGMTLAQVEKRVLGLENISVLQPVF